MMNLAPTLVLNDFRSYSAVELYGLFQEIYSGAKSHNHHKPKPRGQDRLEQFGPFGMRRCPRRG